MDHNFIKSFLLASGISGTAYATQFINAAFTVATAIVITISLYFINRSLKKLWP